MLFDGKVQFSSITGLQLVPWLGKRFGGGGGSPIKMTAIMGEGRVKKIGKLRRVLQFLNGASQIPPDPLPPTLVPKKHLLN